MPDSRPSVLFVCVHNAGRSQMAAGFLRALSCGSVDVRCAGSLPADQINPAAVEAMAEVGIDLHGEQPKLLTADAVQTSDVVVTMGCGDACPYHPGTRYEDWPLDDPAGQGLAAIRPIRDEIRHRVEDLLASLGGTRPRSPADAGTPAPSVLFVCVKNGGKSQLAAALMRQHAGDSVAVASAGTRPGTSLNAESVASLDELGVSTTGEHPKPVTDQLLDAADLVVLLGTEAHLEDARGTPVETWETDEPSQRGITGMERMRLVRDDISRRVDELHHRLLAATRAMDR